MKKILIIAGMLITMNSYAQKTLEECQKLARLHYPEIEQLNLIERTKAYDIKNVNKGYLPGVGLNAKATYQTSVVEIPIPIPNFKPLSKGQESVMVEIDQVVWDGGVMRAQKKMIHQSSRVDSMNVEVNLYALRDRINSLYFGILLFREQLRLNDLLTDELNRNYKTVQSYVASGIAMKSDLDVVAVELLNNKQQRQEIVSGEESYREMLSVMIGERVDSLVTPEMESIGREVVLRPELIVFDTQMDQLETSLSAIRAKNMPKLGVFVQGAYANPGLNFLKSGFSPYAIGGVKLSWNIGSLYTLKSDKGKIEVTKNQVDVGRRNFMRNTDLSVVEVQSGIRKLELQMKEDDAIVALRNSIKKASQAKVEHGTMSVSDLVTDILSEQMALQNRAIHQIMLLKTIYDYKFITNN